jgi:hypothetical protein
MEENKKLTKKDYFGMIREMVEGATVENKEELLAFVDKQVEMLDAKADKAKARAAEKRAEGDELRATVKAVLTNEFQGIEDILPQVEGEEITKAKIIARLTQLVKAGEVEKAKAKTEDKKEITVYKLAE